jgi:hypothetical protein
MSTKIAAIRAKAELIGQILLYGSIGTASSATVYILHDQIRQVRQWRHMIDSGRKLQEMARKHGFSETTIQRLNDPSLETFLLEQQRRGKVRLDLVEDIPKFTSSPHRGQVYYVVPTSKKRKRPYTQKRTCQQPNRAPQNIREFLSRSIPLWNEIFATNRGRARPDMWQERPKIAINQANRTFEYSHRMFSTNARGRRVVSSQFACKNIQSRFSTIFPGGQLSTSALPMLSPDDTILKTEVLMSNDLESRCRQFLQRHGLGSHNPGRSISEMSVSEMSELVLSVASDAPLDPLASRTTASLLSELIQCGELSWAQVTRRLHKRSAFTILLQLIQQQSQEFVISWKSAELTFAALVDSVKTGLVRKAWSRDIFDKLIPHLRPQSLAAVWMRRSTAEEAIRIADFLLPPILSAVSEGRFIEATLLQKILDWSKSEIGQEHFFKLISSGLANPSHGDSAFSLDVLLHFGLPGIRLYLSSQEDLNSTYREAVNHMVISALNCRQYVQVLQLIERGSNALNPQQLRQVSLHLMTCFSPTTSEEIDLSAASKIVQLYFRHELLLDKSEIVSFIQDIYLCKTLSLEIRSKFLDDVLSIIKRDLDLVSDILNPSSLPKDHDMCPTLGNKREHLLVGLWNDTKDISHVTKYFSKFHNNPVGPEFPLMQAMLRIAVECKNDKLMSSTAWAMFENLRPDLASRWRELHHIMPVLAKCGQITALTKILEALSENSFFSVGQENKVFTDIYPHLVLAIPPEDALTFIEDNYSKYGMVLGPRAFVSLLFRSITYAQLGSCSTLVQRLIELNSKFQHPVENRGLSVRMAFQAARQRHPKAAIFLNELLTEIAETDDSLISKNLCLDMTRWLAADTLQEKTFSFARRKFGRANRLRSEFVTRASALRELADSCEWLSQKISFKHQYFEHPTALFPGPGKRDWLFREKDLLCETRVLALHTIGDYKSAVEEFQRFISEYENPTPKLARVGAQALLALKTPEVTARLFDYLKTKGGPLARYLQIRYALKEDENVSSSDIRQMIMDWYKDFSHLRPPQLHKLLAGAIDHMIHPKSPTRPSDKEGALQLLMDIYNSAYIKLVPSDLALYSAFISVYSALHDIQGIMWTFLNLFKSNISLISSGFHRVIINASSRMIDEMRGKDDHRLREAKILWFHLKQLAYKRYVWQKSEEQSDLREVFQIILRQWSTKPALTTEESNDQPAQIDQKLNEFEQRKEDAVLLSTRGSQRKQALKEALDYSMPDDPVDWKSLDIDTDPLTASLSSRDLELLEASLNQGPRARKTSKKADGSLFSRSKDRAVDQRLHDLDPESLAVSSTEELALLEESLKKDSEELKTTLSPNDLEWLEARVDDESKERMIVADNADSSSGA